MIYRTQNIHHRRGTLKRSSRVMPGLRGMPAGIRTKSQPVRHLKQRAANWNWIETEIKKSLHLRRFHWEDSIKRLWATKQKRKKNTLFSFWCDGNDNKYITPCKTVAPWWLRPQTPEGARSALTQPPSRSPSRHSSWRSKNHRLTIHFSGVLAVSFREGSSWISQNPQCLV